MEASTGTESVVSAWRDGEELAWFVSRLDVGGGVAARLLRFLLVAREGGLFGDAGGGMAASSDDPMRPCGVVCKSCTDEDTSGGASSAP